MDDGRLRRGGDIDDDHGMRAGADPVFLECVVTPLVVKGHDGRRAGHLRWVPPAPVPALKRLVGRGFVSPLCLQRHLTVAIAADSDNEPGNASGRRLCFLECVVTPLVVKGHDGRRADHLRWVPSAPVPALKRLVGRGFVSPLRLRQHLKVTTVVAAAAAADSDIEPGNASGRRLCLLECVVAPLVVKGHDGRRADHLRWVPFAPVPALKRQVGRCFAIPRRGRAPAPHGRRAVFKTGFLAHLTPPPTPMFSSALIRSGRRRVVVVVDLLPGVPAQSGALSNICAFC
ncbi:hypothetical protein EV714DRAFT_271301 [Schizophyllum commune]